MAAASLIIVTALTLLVRFPPGQYRFYPVCPIYQFFHVLCPGCGTTRAIAALLKGHAADALRLNPLTTLLLPLLLLYFFALNWHVVTTRAIVWPHVEIPVMVGLFAVTAAFTIIQNL